MYYIRTPEYCICVVHVRLHVLFGNISTIIYLFFFSLIYSSSLVSHSRSLQEMTAFRKNIFPGTQGGMWRLVDMAISIFSQSHWDTFVIWVWKVWFWSNLGTEALAVSLCLVRRLLQTDIFFSYRSCSLVSPYMGGSKIRPAKFVAAKKKQSRKQRASVKNQKHLALGLVTWQEDQFL